MYAHMGMEIEEWVDGRVNIGVAVCPSKPTAIITAVGARKKEKGNGVLVPRAGSAAGNFVVIPKSAFIIRAPEHCQSQSGLSVTYAHQPSRPPNLIIMLTPQDQGYPDKISCQQATNLLSNQSNDYGIIEKTMKQIENNTVELQKVAEICANSEEKVHSEDVENSEVGKQGRDKKSSSNCEITKGLTLPQHTSGVAEASTGESRDGTAESEKQATGYTGKQMPTTPLKRSSDMKRVSWVEDAGIEGNKGSGKDSKKETMRKSNGMGNGHTNRGSPTKKQSGVTAEDVNNVDVYTKGSKRNGDKSRIPHITSPAVADYPTTCEFYRRQMLRECMYNNPSTTVDNWYGYTSIQKYAGQKVVKKITEEQKRLEEDISSRRKTEIWILGTETDDLVLSPPTVPLRKRTTRLKPMQIVH